MDSGKGSEYKTEQGLLPLGNVNARVLRSSEIPVTLGRMRLLRSFCGHVILTWAEQSKSKSQSVQI